MKTCPAHNCTAQISDGLILCGKHFGMLPPDLKAQLIWHHPDAAAQRKVKAPPGRYGQLLTVALGVIELKEKL